MMFSPTFKKGGASSPENPSPGSSNSLNRLPVGNKSVGDENQHIRIQLAVHKYNNSNNSLGDNRCNFISPTKHSFFKTSFKSKCFESGADLTQKTEQKCENRYEGVGSFPTVHLKKSAVLYRPMRKFNEVKVPYPELPVNRFLYDLPELCSDIKPSTRSVLDVLQDLSRKRINSRSDNNNYRQYRSKGLGGDLPPDEEALSKPLFVQKPKENTIVTKDSFTQTLLPQNIDAPNHLLGNNNKKTDDSDPRTQLRRKLAKQNNEIFASLSSSLPSTFALKRKIDKISSVSVDENKSYTTRPKKLKIFDNYQTTGDEVNKFKTHFNNKANYNELGRKIRKHKLGEGKATSPNKDRLTTIFLDMENTSPKSQVFQNNLSPNETKYLESNSNTPILSNCSTFGKENGTVNGVRQTNSALLKDNNSSSNVTESNNLDNSSTLHNKETKIQTNNSILQSSLSVTENGITKTNDFQFKCELVAKTNSKEKSFSEWTQDCASKSSNSPSATSSLYNSKNNLDDKLNNANTNSTAIAKSFTFGSSNKVESNNLGSFKFGSNENVMQNLNKVEALGSFKFGSNENLMRKNGIVKEIEDTKKTISGTTTFNSLSNTTSLPIITSIPQFSFVSNSITATSVSLPISSQSNQAKVSNNHSAGFLTKQGFTIGQSKTENSLNNENNTKEKAETSINGFSFTTSISSTSTCSLTKNTFVFGQKINSNDSTKNDEKNAFSFGQNKGLNILSQSNSQNENKEPLKNALPTSQAFTSGIKSQEDSSTAAVINQNNQFLLNNNESSATPASKESSLLTDSTFVNNSLGQSNLLGNSSAPVKVCNTTPATQSSMTFNLEQKSSGPKENQGLECNSTEQKNSTKLFSFEQTAATKEPGETSNIFGVTTNLSSAISFEKNLSKSGVQSSQNDSLFTQSSSNALAPTQASQTVTLTQNQNYTAKPTTTFGATNEPFSFGSTSTTSVFNQNENTFTSKSNIFANTSTTSSSLGGFNIPTTRSATKFNFSTSGFGGSTSSTTAAFGSTGGPINFGPSNNFTNTSTPQSNSTFGATSTTQSTPCFSLNSTSSVSTFGQSFGQTNAPNSNSQGMVTNNIFQSNGVIQNSSISTGFATPSNSNFNSPTNQNLFGQKPNSDQGNSFVQATKVQTPPFGSNTSASSFNAPNQFSFGAITSNVTAFTTSPKTAGSSVFTFSASTSNSSSSSSFGNPTSTGSSNTSTPFTFSNNNNNNAFKFGGTSASKEGPAAYGNVNSSTFVFGGQTNSNTTLNTKPAGTGFNFGASQTFNFGSSTSPSPSVFSFGGSGSTGSSSGFNFGTPQPGGPFGQPNASPSTFSVPGTFSIGSGSTQSRPRASSRLRRRP